MIHTSLNVKLLSSVWWHNYKQMEKILTKKRKKTLVWFLFELSSTNVTYSVSVDALTKCYPPSHTLCSSSNYNSSFIHENSFFNCFHDTGQNILLLRCLWYFKIELGGNRLASQHKGGLIIWILHAGVTFAHYDIRYFKLLTRLC